MLFEPHSIMFYRTTCVPDFFFPAGNFKEKGENLEQFYQFYLANFIFLSPRSLNYSLLKWEITLSLSGSSITVHCGRSKTVKTLM